VNELKYKIRIVLASMKLAFQHNMIDGFIIFTILVQPLLVAILALWMLQGKGPEYTVYIVVGSGMSGLWSSLLFVSGNAVNAERRFGTLETLTGVPAPLQLIIFGKTLANVLQSLLSMIGTYILASSILGYPVSIAMPGFFFASIIFTLFAFISFGLIISPVFILSPEIQQLQNGFEFPVFILSGFLFPILLLPGWLQPFSYLLPTYWAANALHISSRASGTAAEILLSWGILFISSLFFFWASSRIFNFMIRKAREAATLDTR
jgi:ABC-2 type transport system permease protein